ncbi:energy transducer TonB [Psychrosphaera ytuae]|uniref:Protein TonB n=1 Tax=Psychrosphaera ytuae TaxID=2820710 RepID=A0A975DA79_9GAMM|nr:energy transducer TonB [Psychrosphaera ytuae]QTH63039.1 energy transducer TonB [Psychrosphaera ytuae]
MFVRLLTALALAAVVTVALLYGMQALIKSGDSAITEPAQGSVLDFIRLKQEETVQKKERKPQKPPKPQEPPPPMDQPQMAPDTADASDAGFDFSADVAADVSLDGGLALESGDGEYLPIVKVQPVYPRRALQRGIEGYVIVEFTVDRTGAVKDPMVIEAEPQGLFDRAAMDAALKFKYKPRVVNGEPTEVSGVQNRITFELNG